MPSDYHATLSNVLIAGSSDPTALVGTGSYAERFQGPQESSVAVPCNIIQGLNNDDNDYLLDGIANTTYFIVSNASERDERDDYTLLAASAAVDSGYDANRYINQGSVDLAGAPRKVGLHVDVGALER